MDLTYSVTTTYIGLQEDFAFWLAGRGASASTVKSYLRDLAVFTRWFEGANRQGFDVHYLTSTDLRAWREHSLQVEHVLPTTWNRRLAMLRNLAAWAREGGLIEHDPLRGVLRARDGRKTAPRSLEKPDFGRLMRQLEVDVLAANTPRRRALAIRDAALVGLMEYAGLREGEASRLLVGDVEIGERSGHVRVYNGKGGKYAEVELAREARYLVGEWLVVHPSPGAGERLFPSLSPRAIQKRVAGLGRRARVEGLTPHRLRHTFVKRMIDAGVPLPTVQDLARHAKTETTARYGLPTSQDRQNAVDAIQAI